MRRPWKTLEAVDLTPVPCGLLSLNVLYFTYVVRYKVELGIERT